MWIRALSAGCQKRLEPHFPQNPRRARLSLRGQLVIEGWSSLLLEAAAA